MPKFWFRFSIIGFLLLLFSIFLIWQFFIQPCYEAVYLSEQQQQKLELSLSNATSNHKPLILVWTKIFSKQSLKLESDCPLYDKCQLTYDHGELPHANAVIFHIPDIKWVQQVIGPSMSFDLPELPDIPPYNQRHSERVNVFLSQENPSSLFKYYNTKELAKTSRNYFHSVMSHLRTSHLPMPYGGFWVYPEKTKQLGFPPVQLPTDSDTILKGKRVKGILWFVSNCNSSSKRELAVKALSKYIPVKIAGKCANNSEDRKLCPRSTPNCDYLFDQYYFYIAAENDVCKDYITEKWWNRYKLPAIPIVLRKWIYEGIVPNNYIAMDEFRSPKQMAEYLHHLMDNTEEYLRHFEWRRQNWSIAPWNHENYRIGQCGLCERLLRLANREEPMPSTMPNAVKWFEEESHCEGGKFAEQWSKEDEEKEAD